jgi:hypothetical protein
MAGVTPEGGGVAPTPRPPLPQGYTNNHPITLKKKVIPTTILSLLKKKKISKIL